MSTPPQNPSARAAQGSQPRAGAGDQSATGAGRKDVRATAAENLEKLAGSAKAAATQLEGDDVGHISHYVSELADGMTRFSSSLRDTSGDEILRDVARLARDNPALFITGSVAIGFALTRFSRASSGPEPKQPESMATRDSMRPATAASPSLPASPTTQPGSAGSAGSASFDATRAPGSRPTSTDPTSSDPSRPGTPRGGIH